jgi:hypothetical protein
VINRTLPGKVRRKIRLTEGNAKSLRIKSNLKNVFAASVILSPPLLGVGLGVVKQFYMRLLNLVTYRV